MSDNGPQSAGLKAGGFFGIDRRAWPKVCECGLNAAGAYLVQARGTGGDNKTTSWSALAVSKYLGISRTKAKLAIGKLQEAGLTRLLVDGKRPRYEIVPACGVPGTSAYPREPLSCLEREAVERSQTHYLKNRSDISHARRAVDKGWLSEHERGDFSLAPEPDPKPDIIWLPNTLVTGASAEVPPLALVRQCQDVMTLRLLVDLYGAHVLRENGGVRPTVILCKHERLAVGQQGQYTVWGFRPRESRTADLSNEVISCHRRDKLTDEEREAGENAGVDFFPRLHQLEDLGLIEWIPTLFESADPEAEVIHPLGMGDTECIEDRLGGAAHVAAAGLLTDGQRDRAADEGLILVPLPRHISKVTLISIARLRYRPKTRATAAWWAELGIKGERHIAIYNAIALCGTPSSLAANFG